MHPSLFRFAVASVILTCGTNSVSTLSSSDVPITSSITAPPTFITAPFINASRINAAQEPECLQQASSPFMMKPISIVHCYQLLTHLVARFSSSPVQWNTPDHPTRKLWTWGTCMISFDRSRLDSWDVFSELQVAKAAASVVVKCVRAETLWLGGRLPVGPRMEFVVAVYGRGQMGQETETV